MILLTNAKQTQRKNNQTLLTNPLFVTAAAVFCTMVWGTAFPCIKIGYELFAISGGDIPSKLIFAGNRFALAGMVVLLIGLLTKPKAMVLHKQDLAPVLSLALFQTFLQYLLLYIGIVHITGTKTAVLNSVAAFGAVIFSALFFQNDRLTAGKIIGCLLGAAGIVIMNFGDSLLGFTLMGDGLVILSNLSGAFGNVLSKKYVKTRSPLMLTGYQLLTGGLVLTAAGYMAGGQLVFRNTGCLLMLFYLALVAGIPFMLWTMLLAHNDVSRIAAFNLLIPVFGTMWSGIFLGENILTLTNILSLLPVCTGIFLVSYRFKKRKA